MKISVVTITLNRKDFLKKAIESVLNQNYINYEHIIIDGGSNDGTIELLHTYQHLKWISEPDGGQADAMNKGLSLMTGDVFAWLNSDDTYPEGTLNKVISYFNQWTDVAMIYGRCNLVNKSGHSLGHTRMHDFNLHRMTMGFNNINTPAVFVRTTAIRYSGVFDLSLKATYDVDMWIRIAQKYKVKPVNEIFSNLCLHRGSGLVGQKAHIKELPIIREKYWRRRSLFDIYILFPYLKLRYAAFDYIRFNRIVKGVD